MGTRHQGPKLPAHGGAFARFYATDDATHSNCHGVQGQFVPLTLRGVDPTRTFGRKLVHNQAFRQYNSRHTGMAALMVPASRLEKVLSALVMNLIFVVPLLLLFLFLHD